MTSRAAFFIVYGLPYLIGANLLLVAMCMDSRWPIPHSELLPMVGLPIIIILDVFVVLRMMHWLLVGRQMAHRYGADTMKWRDILVLFHPHSLMAGVYPSTTAFVESLFLTLFFGIGALVVGWAILAFCTVPLLPVWLRWCFAIDAVGIAGMPMTLSFLCAEGGVILIIRRIKWRGDSMTEEQFTAWKAANPGAPMPWERGHHRVCSGPADCKGVKFHDKGSSDDRQTDG